MDRDSKIILVVGLILAVVVIGFLINRSKSGKLPGELDGFASCLVEKKAIFYGAFWCSHCQAQKKMFGRSASKLPYVECSTPNGQDRLKVCLDAGIESYPTWIFADGSVLKGEQQLSTLAEKTGCELPVKVE